MADWKSSWNLKTVTTSCEIFNWTSMLGSSTFPFKHRHMIMRRQIAHLFMKRKKVDVLRRILQMSLLWSIWQHRSLRHAQTVFSYVFREPYISSYSPYGTYLISCYYSRIYLFLQLHLRKNTGRSGKKPYMIKEAFPALRAQKLICK